MKKIAAPLCMLLLLAGCLSPSFQTLGEVDVECRVIEFPTMSPIIGASALWEYVGPAGESVSFGPFTSDARGIFKVVVPAQKLPLSRSAGYFAGGYFRQINISAPGFRSGHWGEGDLRERIEKNSTRPIEFRLKKQEPNPKGATTP